MLTENVANDPNPTNNGTVNYSLDAVGNRLTRSSTLAQIASTTSTYDSNDRLTSDGYDANGNTKTSNGASYNYDFENRLTSLTASDSSLVTFVYDGDGNRVAKTSGGVTTGYLIDELSPTGYAQVVEEVAGGSAQRTYTYGSALISQKVVGSNQVSFYGSDAHGNVRLLTNSWGEITNTYDYDAFGNLINTFGSTPNDYLYTTERFDPDLGAYYLRERYYNPRDGRFLTSDPFAGFTDLPRTLHKYLYVSSDPVNYIDPSGRAETTEYKLRGTLQPKAQIRIPCIVAKIDGLFSILDWTGYPSGLPTPDGPFRILEGDDYARPRSAADTVNKKIHLFIKKILGSHSPFDVHELRPVKFGGNPTAPANKYLIPPSLHDRYTKWWNKLGRDLKNPYGKC